MNKITKLKINLLWVYVHLLYMGLMRPERQILSVQWMCFNDDINIHHAQLIFNTHNPIFLNSNLFRRDEIKFVERDDNSHFSTLYALSDIGTSGEKGVRKHEDYMKNYFISQYGAIKDIDFTPIFEEILANEGEV